MAISQKINSFFKISRKKNICPKEKIKRKDAIKTDK